MRIVAFFVAAVVMAAAAAAALADSTASKLVLTKDTLAGLKEYQSKVGSVGNGYFAVSVDGVTWAYWLCKQTVCTGSRAGQKSKALDDCRKGSQGVDCVILARDQDVILEYEGPPTDKPRPAALPASAPPAPPADQLGRVDHPGWAVDEEHGCWIWNRAPEANDRVTWSGACSPSGPAEGEGVLEWVGQERFTGTLQQGRKTGKGRLVYADGGHVEATWIDGRINGQGMVVWADGSRYEGEWKDSVPDGYGTYTYYDEKYVGQWKNGCFDDGKTRYAIYKEDTEWCEKKKN